MFVEDEAESWCEVAKASAGVEIPRPQMTVSLLSIEGSRAPLLCLLEGVLSVVSLVLSSITEESKTVGLGRVGVKDAALGFMLLLLLAASCSLAISLLVVMLGEWPVLKLTLRAIPWFTLLALPGGLDLSMEPLLDVKEFEDTLLSRPGL